MNNLVKSIGAIHVLSPLLVVPNEQDPSKGFVIAGARRLYGALKANKTEIEVRAFNSFGSESKRLEVMLTDNLHHEPLPPVDEARLLARTLEQRRAEGRDAQQQTLAETLGLDPSYISKRLALLALPERIQQLVNTGSIPAKAGWEIAQIKGKDAKTTLRLQMDAAQRVLKEGATVQDLNKTRFESGTSRRRNDARRKVVSAPQIDDADQEAAAQRPTDTSTTSNHNGSGRAGQQPSSRPTVVPYQSPPAPAVPSPSSSIGTERIFVLSTGITVTFHSTAQLDRKELLAALRELSKRI